MEGLENHPIPQNITGFEFKLIGDMSLKQFAYLAAGAITAWVVYSLPLFSLIKFPIVFLAAGTGAAFAFLPVDGRPLDLMLKNFIKAVFSPTEYVYQKAGGDLLTKDEAKLKDFNKKRLTVSEMSDKQLSAFLKNLPKGLNKLDKKEMVFFQSLNSYGQTASPTQVPGYVPQHAYAGQEAAQQAQPASPNQTSQIPNVFAPKEDLQKTAELLTKELQEAKAKESAQPQINTKEYLDAHQKVLELQKNLNDLSMQKQQLETRIIELQKQQQTNTQQVYSPSIASQPQQQTQYVRSVPSNLTQSVGLPSSPEFPNIITGIVKDPRGNPLPNILVEVKDAQANAVRAFKTNALGHFASATPLINGSYTIEFEDPKNQNKFDSVGFVAKGEIILPIEVISVDQREELRRSLFN